MKTIYFVRHGQSEGNASLLTQQGPHTLLTKHGEAQAAEVAQHINKLPVEAIVASTFARAQATAEAIGKATGVLVEHSDLMVEARRPGVQLRKKKLHPSWLVAQLKLSLFSRFNTYRHSDEETPEDLLIRARAALMYLSERPESVIVVVTHGRFMRALHAAMTLGDGVTGRAYLRATRAMRVRNTALMVATYEDAVWKVQSWNTDAKDL